MDSPFSHSSHSRIPQHVRANPSPCGATPWEHKKKKNHMSPLSLRLTLIQQPLASLGCLDPTSTPVKGAATRSCKETCTHPALCKSNFIVKCTDTSFQGRICHAASLDHRNQEAYTAATAHQAITDHLTASVLPEPNMRQSQRQHSLCAHVHTMWQWQALAVHCPSSRIDTRPKLLQQQSAPG